MTVPAILPPDMECAPEADKRSGELGFAEDDSAKDVVTPAGEEVGDVEDTFKMFSKDDDCAVLVVEELDDADAADAATVVVTEPEVVEPEPDIATVGPVPGLLDTTKASMTNSLGFVPLVTMSLSM